MEATPNGTTPLTGNMEIEAPVLDNEGILKDE
jgi:magnesium-transporting ATPase (P-type)